MKRISTTLGLALLPLWASGCLDTAEIQTRVNRDGTVNRKLEFVVDSKRKDAFREVFRLPGAPQWTVRDFETTARSSNDTLHHYVAARTFGTPGRKRSDFVVRPFRSSGPLGSFEGRNAWRVTRRRGLFHTTYAYEEVLHFPGLRDAYVKTLSDVLHQHLARKLPLNEAESRRLLPEVQHDVEVALEKQSFGTDRDFVTLVTDYISARLNRIRSGTIESEEERPKLISARTLGMQASPEPKGSVRSLPWLRQQIQDAYNEFYGSNLKEGSEDEGADRTFLYSFAVTLPGRITRTNGQAFGPNRVLWKNVLGFECQFHEYTLFAESRVWQMNWIALLSIVVLLVIPATGTVKFLRRYRLIIRVTSRETN